MELHMQSHRYTHRWPDWRAAALAGLVAGVVFLVLDLLAAMLMGASVWKTLTMIGAILLGPDVLTQTATFQMSVLLAAVGVHFVLSVVFALILATIMAPFHFDSSVGMASVVGALFGLGLLLVNFYGMTAVFPWFAEARGWVTAIAHIVFGLVAADSYLKLERHADAPAGA
ncbi:hypothetical protein BJN34_08245 [Cupriavidus necator]|uniref:Uncharacterized protein n=1 Tax=Cupriavidus necator TaxID=106590 RepID=A0A1U9UMS3_CUPNE|nr:hypothetical protein [Cupriavidus necator]AQV93879.1 hypothetical protein BJN34_08245 [Cupriavidus necator]